MRVICQTPFVAHRADASEGVKKSTPRAYSAGDIAEFPEAQAQSFIDAGMARDVESTALDTGPERAMRRLPKPRKRS